MNHRFLFKGKRKMQKMRHTRLSRLWVSGISGDQELWSLSGSPGLIPPPCPALGQLHPWASLRVLQPGGKGLMPHPVATTAAVGASQPVAPRNSLRTQSWPWLASLADLALAGLCSQGGVSTALSLRQINFLTVVATTFLNPAWIKHMSWHCTDQPVRLIDFPSMS